ncbi:polyprenol reductase [Anoplophora glabripennis]|uniref:polyprenol reductase n=1 Tax=Anoplophora glabripennis TaxID=217634 RepID=UPI0008740323|nr:polyprenol reductase [Anoplophora glabripennis]
MNYILLGFSFLTSTIILGSSLLNTLESKLPIFFVENFRYGKFGVKNKVSKIVVKVPKSWFKHFYMFAIYFFPYIFYLVTSTYMFNSDVPKWFIQLLNITCGEDRVATTSATKTYIALTLLTLQVFRRFYDTHYVSVFGKHGEMCLSHYLVGLYHYPGCVLAILCEAPKFANILFLSAETFNVADISKLDIAVIIVFMWAWWHQHLATRILANLRKDKKGNVVSESHKVPHGDWFNYVTAPHQTAEILMYLALTILLWKNFTWFFVFIWVLSNQIETILLTHWWYLEEFKDFPKNRKALIPFVY